jgi:hypothetical protein
VISGTVSLPKGIKAAQDVKIRVLFSTDNNQHRDYDRVSTKDLIIHTGSNSARYSIEVPSNSEGYIIYQYESSENTFCYRGFYSTKGTTFNFSKATKVKLQKKNVKNINLQLLKGKRLNGKVTIPANVDDVWLCDVNPVYDNGTPDNLNDDVFVFQSQNSFASFYDERGNSKKEASYCMIVPDITATYRIKYEVSFNNVPWGGSHIISEGYYSKSCITCDYDKADSIMVSSSYVGKIDIHVIESRKIQGKICLPDGKKANSNMGVILFNDEGAREKFIKIPKGENSVEYTLYFQDWKHKHIVTVGHISKYYFGQNEVVSDKSSAKEFDLSKGDIKGFDVIIPEGVFTCESEY